MSDSEEASSSEFLIESGDSDISSSDENLNTGLYNNEPEYSKEEYKKEYWIVLVKRMTRMII